MSGDIEAFVNGTSPEDETLFERRMRVVMLRNAGVTFTDIARQLKISATQARKDLSAGLRDILADTAEDMIARQRSVTLDLQKANYKKMLEGDIDAGRLILSALEREAKLFGLDAPTRVNVGVSDIEFAEKTAALIESVGGTPPADLLKAIGHRADAIGHRAGATVIDAEPVAPAAAQADAEPTAWQPVPADEWSNI
ncbi:Uncharacterised protein [Mycobacteroides abscessus subsp. abscessus]|uniref:hypothetical protein n=1 Tax=Mycobacteroides abscessus TaxID=36809 RepID=UPI00092A070A|nr:hypothetical protein [Mycobacteroides abscessus]SHT84149.1 Uncharacterised protein [Mycobacteroides abscessus subsp. abscessus]SKO51914.1 Uncharacterised protein [Mycobacteroides abscessus subsp. abscessus]